MQRYHIKRASSSNHSQFGTHCIHGAINFKGARHKYQRIAFMSFINQSSHGTRCALPHRRAFRTRLIANTHWIRTAFRSNHRRTEIRGRLSCVHGCAHGRHHQRRALQARRTDHSKCKISKHTALMKFIKQHATNALEQWITLRLAQEHPFGDKSNARARTDHALEPRLESHILAKGHAHLLGHPSRGHACRQPTRLQHHNLPFY